MKSNLLLILKAPIFFLAAILLLIGCSSGGDDDDQGSGDDDADDDSGDDDSGGVTHDVSIVDFAFDPNTVTINAGDSVRWTNDGAVAHTATSGDPGDADAGDVFDSGTLNSGDTFTFEFDEAGDYVYHCDIHESMMFGAHVIVE